MNENSKIMEAELSENEVLEGELWEDDAPRKLPMRWYKFEIYFALWLGAFRNLSTIAVTVYSMLKADPAYWSTVPAAYLVVCALEMVFIAVLICVQICVRFKLARFRKNAPRLLLISYGLLLFGHVVFALAGSLSLGLAPLTGFKTAYVVGAMFMILANNKYYYRRRHLFVN